MDELTFKYDFEDNVPEKLDPVEEAEKENEKNPKKDDLEERIAERKNITEVEDLDFDEPESQSEGVGDEKDNKGEEDADGNEDRSTSPLTFSSIAEAFAEGGIFPDLEDEDIKNVKTAEDFMELAKKQIQAQLDETQQRISKALDAGVESSAIRSYEGVLRQLNSITDEMLSDESPKGENLRIQLIQRDYMNRGISSEKALKIAKRSVENSTDIDDARDALAGNLEFYKGEYDKIVKDAQAQADRDRKDREAQEALLKKSILEDDKFFGEMQVDKATRQKIYDNISKPVYRDKSTGDVFTAVQKYEMDHPTEFLKYVSMFYTLTDGFSDLKPMIGGPVKKGVNKGIKNLERLINNTARTSDGNLDFLGGTRDKESSGRKVMLDI